MYPSRYQQRQRTPERYRDNVYQDNQDDHQHSNYYGQRQMSPSQQQMPRYPSMDMPYITPPRVIPNPPSPSNSIPKKWNLFPHRFLKAYGAPEEITNDHSVLGLLEPFNCEWFRRPGMALSMFSQAVTECVPIVETYGGTVLNENFTQTITDNFSPLIPTLDRLNNKKKKSAPPTTQDIKDFLTFALQENDELDAVLDDTIHASAAMLILATQAKAAIVLCRNPDLYSQKVSSQDNSHAQFASDGQVSSLRRWFEVEALPLSATRIRPHTNELVLFPEKTKTGTPLHHMYEHLANFKNNHTPKLVPDAHHNRPKVEHLEQPTN